MKRLIASFYCMTTCLIVFLPLSKSSITGKMIGNEKYFNLDLKKVLNLILFILNENTKCCVFISGTQERIQG